MTKSFSGTFQPIISSFGSDMLLYLLLYLVSLEVIVSLCMCRTGRNECTVDVDHEPAKEATCKAELTIPSHHCK